MPKLPVISGKILIKKLEEFGYETIRQKGSHIRLKSDHPNRKPVTIPLHKAIKPGLLHRILKDADLSAKDLSDT